MKYHIKLCDAIGHVFLDEEGKMRRDLMPDGLHPDEEGYRAWGKAMEPTIAKLLGEDIAAKDPTDGKQHQSR